MKISSANSVVDRRSFSVGRDYSGTSRNITLKSADKQDQKSSDMDKNKNNQRIPSKYYNQNLGNFFGTHYIGKVSKRDNNDHININHDGKELCSEQSYKVFLFYYIKKKKLRQFGGKRTYEKYGDTSTKDFHFPSSVKQKMYRD